MVFCDWGCMRVIGHLKHSSTAQTLYVRHVAPPDPVRRAALEAAVGLAFGLSVKDDGRPDSHGVVFDTSDYQGEYKLDELTVDSFNGIIILPVIDIRKAGPFEVQVPVGWLISDDDELYLIQGLEDHDVRFVETHPYLGPSVLVLTVLGMDDSPNISLLQKIGVDLCRLLVDRWSSSE